MPGEACNIMRKYVCVCQRRSETDGEREKDATKVSRSPASIVTACRRVQSPWVSVASSTLVNLGVITESQAKQENAAPIVTSQKALGGGGQMV